jgi:hypothetical protein
VRWSASPDGSQSQNERKGFLAGSEQGERSGLADHRTTGQLPRKADVIIIGSGIAGTLTAYNLLQREPHLNILMLEAREVCGESGWLAEPKRAQGVPGRQRAGREGRYGHAGERC